MHEAKERLGLRLVGRYTDIVARVVAALKAQAKDSDVLRAVVDGRLPRDGVLGEGGEGGEYRFHGIGCEATIEGVEVDFDFGPAGRHDGFDAWRLHLFAKNLPEFADFHQLSAVESLLARMEQLGLIHSPRWLPSPHLMYLTDVGKGTEPLQG
jgi:hypothetical protein